MSTRPEALIQRLCDGDAIPWHHHNAAYAAIVVEGGYEEAGDDGRWLASAGHVIVHGPFSAHRDRIDPGGAAVVNIPLPIGNAFLLASGRVTDPLTLIADIRSNAGEAVDILTAAVLPAQCEEELPDGLAAALLRDPSISISAWAVGAGTSVRTLHRRFTLAYGVTPKHFRARAKARRAWSQLCLTDEALPAIAHDAGFADQAHMSRGIRWLTGRSPREWRLADTFKTAVSRCGK